MDILHCLYLKLLLLLSLNFIFGAWSTDPYTNALLSLKSEILDHHNNLSDWSLPFGGNSSDNKKIHACSWSGVKCDSESKTVIGLDLSVKNLGGVLSVNQFSLFADLVELNLSYNAFSGELPVGIFNLTNLKTLDISRNNFSGEFPGGVSGLANLVVLDAFSNSFSGPLPAEVSRLGKLKVLNFAGSYFSGPIPSDYGSFRSLEFIHLAGNFLSGKLPPELGKLKTVTHMEIGYNSYEGSIPWQLGNMSELQYLDIAGANLSGSIPVELSNLTMLESLFLFRNKLTGLVPSEFGGILPLTSLDLSDNLLTGPIPDSFSELKKLKLLSLMYNEMNGTVPRDIAKLPSLETLLIWSNFFSGSLPEDLGRNSDLKWVDVSTNDFVGEIPVDICSRGVLFKLIMFTNKFTGSLKPAISNCSSLMRLRLEDNSFSGEMSLQLPEITYVDLSRNNFTGGIPGDISQASQLQYFNISNNPGLGGVIPPQTWSLPLLQNFSASASGVSGNVPPFHSCESVSVIELNENNLAGEIPTSISKCAELEIVNLAHNKFSSNIPEEIASLPVLTVLDLSCNNFTGRIPAKFGHSSSLELLNVSYNDISGSIPSSTLFKLMGSSAFEGNPGLCGAPLRPCPASMAIFGTKGTSKLALILLLCAGAAILVVASALGMLFIRKRNNARWEMISFAGLPQFTANDILRSFNTTETIEQKPPQLVCKAILPTGITVSLKKIELKADRTKTATEYITQLGNARHKNLVRLLGFCYNKKLGYVLYDYLPNGNLADKLIVKRDWSTKYKLVIGIARGLCFLHHDCHPAIPHGNLNSSNVVFDENMEPHLVEFGFKQLLELAGGTHQSASSTETDNDVVKEKLYKDVYSFGEIVLEILTNGKLTNAGTIIHNKRPDVILREIRNENGSESAHSSVQEEIKQVLEVALRCTANRPCDRPFMEDALKHLLGPKQQRK